MERGMMDLATLFGGLQILRRGEWISTVNQQIPDDVAVLATAYELEGITRIIDASYASTLDLDNEPVFTCLPLNIHSALESVGLTKTVSSTLADAGVNCNAIAGFYHDYLLVPVARADQAEQRLNTLKGSYAPSGGWSW